MMVTHSSLSVVLALTLLASAHALAVGATTCYSGHYAVGDFCYSCPCGKYCYGGYSQPMSCHAGRYSYGGASTCYAAAPGQYVPYPGSCRYLLCSPGSYSEYSYSTDCDKCPANTYSDYSGARSCNKCASGTTSTTGSTSCTKTSSSGSGSGSGSESSSTGSGTDGDFWASSDGSILLGCLVSGFVILCIVSFYCWKKRRAAGGGAGGFQDAGPLLRSEQVLAAPGDIVSYGTSRGFAKPPNFDTG